MLRHNARSGMESQERAVGTFVTCKICQKTYDDRSDLIEHLRTEHEILELASYTAATMAGEQERDRMAGEFRRRFDLLKRELTGHDSQR